MNSLTTIPTGEMAVAKPVQTGDEPNDLLRMAVERGADVGTLERLMVVRKELRAEAAKMRFDEALARFQSSCPIIKKRREVRNKQGAVRYLYAPLDDILVQVRELLQANGFSFKLTAEVDDKWVKAICLVTHAAGHEHPSEFKVPIDPEAFMTNQQKFASALTFAKRYAFCNAFGILTCDEDNDGDVDGHDPRVAALQAATERLMKPQAAPEAPSRKLATPAHRTRMLEVLAPLIIRFQALAIDRAWIRPDQSLEEIGLEHVPTTKTELEALKAAIEAHV